MIDQKSSYTWLQVVIWRYTLLFHILIVFWCCLWIGLCVNGFEKSCMKAIKKILIVIWESVMLIKSHIIVFSGFFEEMRNCCNYVPEILNVWHTELHNVKVSYHHYFPIKKCSKIFSKLWGLYSLLFYAPYTSSLCWPMEVIGSLLLAPSEVAMSETVRNTWWECTSTFTWFLIRVWYSAASISL